MFNSRACSRLIIISLCCFMLTESFGFIKIPTPSLLLLVPLKKSSFSILLPNPYAFPPQNVFPVARRLSTVYLLARRKHVLVWFYSPVLSHYMYLSWDPFVNK